MKDVELMVKEIYMKMGNRVPAIKKQFLDMQLVLFMGLKRFSDVNRILIRDIEFKEDGSMGIFINSSKNDQMARSDKFKISGEKMKNGKPVPEIVQWYIEDLKLKKTAYVFCHIDQKAKIEGENVLTYKEAKIIMIKEQIALRLQKISLHSGRIGGASEAAAAGAGRAEILKAGGWRSSCVDTSSGPTGRVKRSAGGWSKG